MPSQCKTTLEMDLGGGAQIVLLRCELFEALGEPYVIHMDITSQLGEIDLFAHLGKSATITIMDNAEASDGARGFKRYLHGIFTEGEYLNQNPSGGYNYRLTLRPKTYIMAQNKGYFIHQNKSALNIIKEYFARVGTGFRVEDRTTRATKSRIYCVQYAESDFEFVSRLMEEEGIYYFFEPASDGHKIILCDSPSAHSAGTPGTLAFRPGAESVAHFDVVNKNDDLSAVFDWQEGVRSRFQKKVSLSDYNYNTAAVDLAVEAVSDPSHPADLVEVHEYPGNYGEKGLGEDFAQFKIEAQIARRKIFSGRTSNISLECGKTFKLTEHTKRYNVEYLLIKTHTVFVNTNHETGGRSLGNSHTYFECVLSNTKWRSLANTPRPVVKGPTTAFVSGPGSETIHTEQYGCVIVRFLWDQTQSEPQDKSCWVRVSQTGARGNIIIPRVGDEVIVDFLDGDPDRPLVVGSVFNSQYKPFYNLPEHKTRATWRSRLYDKEGEKKNAKDVKTEFDHKHVNEITFEDKGGKEKIFIFAQKDYVTQIEHNETREIGADRKTQIGHDEETKIDNDEKREVGNDSTTKIGNNATYDVKVNETRTIGSNLSEKVTADDSREIGGNSSVKISKDHTLKIDGAQDITVQKAITIESTISITLKVGSNKIEISQSGIKIEGMMLNMSATSMAELKSLNTTVKGDAMLTLKGAMTMIN